MEGVSETQIEATYQFRPSPATSGPEPPIGQNFSWKSVTAPTRRMAIIDKKYKEEGVWMSFSTKTAKRPGNPKDVLDMEEQDYPKLRH